MSVNVRRNRDSSGTDVFAKASNNVINNMVFNSATEG